MLNQDLQKISEYSIIELIKPETITKLQDSVFDAITSNDYEMASEIKEVLNAVMLQKSDEIKAADIDVYNSLGRLLDLSRFVILHTLSDEELDQLLSRKILLALNNGVDIRSVLDFRLVLRDDIFLNNQERDRILGVLLENQENINGKKIGQWLSTYDSVIDRSNIRGALQRAQFISQNSEVSKLKPLDKKFLLGVLEIYDFLLFPPEKNIIGKEPQKEIIKENEYILPEMIQDNPLQDIGEDKPVEGVAEHMAKINLEEQRLKESVATSQVIKSESSEPERSVNYVDYQSLVANLLQDSLIQISDESIKKRLENILTSRLRGIRDPLETKLALKESLPSLTDDLASQIVKKANELQNQIASGVIKIKIETKLSDATDMFSSEKIVIAEKEPIPDVLVKESRVITNNGLNNDGFIEEKVSSQASTEVINKESESVKNQEVPIGVKDLNSPDKSLGSDMENPIKIENTYFGKPRVMTDLAKQFIGNQEMLENNKQPAKVEIAKESISQVAKVQDKDRKTFMTIEEVDGVPMIVEKAVETNKVIEPIVDNHILNNQKVQLNNTKIKEVPVIKRVSPMSAHKVDLSDVRVRPKLVDPIEELRLFTLVDFRRLSADVNQAVKRIYQKIKLIEQESSTKKQQAIAAWKESEVYKLYQEMGNDSLGRGLSLGEVISKRQQNNLPFITEREFDALMELNEMIRF